MHNIIRNIILITFCALLIIKVQAQTPFISQNSIQKECLFNFLDILMLTLHKMSF
jgi:hypothetical protein